MKNILIVEDEPLQVRNLERILTDYNDKFTIYTASNSTDAAVIYTDKPIDLFILDVDLSLADSDKNGIDLGIALRIHKQYLNTPIMYVTSIQEKIQSAVNDVHCFYYLTKPYTSEDVARALNAITNSIEKTDNSFTLRDANGVRINLRYDDILYVELSSHALTFNTCNGPFSCRQNGLSKDLDNFPKCFVRVHKSYIINTLHITSYDKTTRTISIRKKSIPVGRAYKNTFEEIYN